MCFDRQVNNNNFIVNKLTNMFNHSLDISSFIFKLSINILQASQCVTVILKRNPSCFSDNLACPGLLRMKATIIESGRSKIYT